MKAEHAKLPGAGIGLKLCPGKCAEEKVHLLDSVRIVRGESKEAMENRNVVGGHVPLFGNELVGKHIKGAMDS